MGKLVKGQVVVVPYAGGNSVQDVVLSSLTSSNWELSAEDAALLPGLDMSEDANLPFTTDIDLDARVVWNMGADEFQGSTQNYYRRRLDQ